mmetsp:Transcript_6360/g.25862  ORF Transcript_6360/g.25862 Transcript_6360/m.25862 type:complete len:315 (-) Transcript_6360:273-1217(-)
MTRRTPQPLTPQHRRPNRNPSASSVVRPVVPRQPGAHVVVHVLVGVIVSAAPHHPTLRPVRAIPGPVLGLVHDGHELVEVLHLVRVRPVVDHRVLQLRGEVALEPGVLLDAGDVQPVHRVQHKDAFDQVLALLAQGDVRRERVVHAADPHDGLSKVPRIRRVLERVRAHHHDVQRDPARPHVRGFAIVRLTRQHLGRDIRRGSHRRLGLRVDERVLRVAKITNLEPGDLPTVQERVLELQVAVSHPVAVTILQPADELLEEEPGLVLVEPSFPADAVEQLAPSRVLHHDREVRGREQHLDEADDVRVVQQAMID